MSLIDILNALDLLKTCLPTFLVSWLRFLLLPIVALLTYLANRLFVLSHLIRSRRSVLKTGSYTSIYVTRLRYEGYLLGLCNDYLAIDFCGMLDRFFIALFLFWGFIRQKYHVSFDVLGRTVFGDLQLRNATAVGLEQVVLLGAGNDTRLHRMEGLPLHLFEVDAPKSQEFKLCHLRKSARNPLVKFVSVDFESESWFEKLKLHGFDPSRKTLFIWEGVSAYLTMPAIRATLTDFAKCAKGSRLVFDFGNFKGPWFDSMKATLDLLGEPVLSMFTPDAMRNLFLEHNLHIVEGPLKAAEHLKHVSQVVLSAHGKIADIREGYMDVGDHYLACAEAK